MSLNVFCFFLNKLYYFVHTNIHPSCFYLQKLKEISLSCTTFLSKYIFKMYPLFLPLDLLKKISVYWRFGSYKILYEDIPFLFNIYRNRKIFFFLFMNDEHSFYNQNSNIDKDNLEMQHVKILLLIVRHGRGDLI